jgi:hypothetical protein
MLISRAGLLRGALAGGAMGAAALPGFVGASTPSNAFWTDVADSGAKPWTRPLPPGASPLRFAVIGDNTGVAKPGVFDQAMRQISWLQPDFILSVGDLIEGYTDDRAEIARQWTAIEASIAKAGVPFVFTPGNHDVDNAETLDAWRERRGPGYYSFLYKGALFVILNTEDTPTPMSPKAAADFYDKVRRMQADPEQAERDTEAQLAASAAAPHSAYGALEVVNLGDRQLGFVRDTLARHPNPRWTFVVIHKPAWKMHSDSFAKIQTMLLGRPHTVFAGHTHYFTHEVLDGHDYINMGSTGGVRHRDGAGTMDHALLVTLTSAGPVYANTRLNGLMDIAGETGQVRAY